MLNIWKAAGPLVIVLAIAACASGTTKVLAPAALNQTFANAKIERAEDSVPVDAPVGERYETTLSELLYAEGLFVEGDGLTIRYRFIQYNKGSRAARYIVGFGAGKGSMTIETVFLDRDGNELARIENGGEISMGFFGGSFNEAVDKAAKETAEYAQLNFSAVPPE